MTPNDFRREITRVFAEDYKANPPGGPVPFLPVRTENLVDEAFRRVFERADMEETQ